MVGEPPLGLSGSLPSLRRAMMSSSDAGNDLCARACPRLGHGARNLPKLARRTEVDLTPPGSERRRADRPQHPQGWPDSIAVLPSLSPGEEVPSQAGKRLKSPV